MNKKVQKIIVIILFLIMVLSSLAGVVLYLI